MLIYSDDLTIKSWQNFWVVIFICLICGPNDYAQAFSKNDHCITLFNNGQINWSTGKISAMGKASPKENNEESNEAVPGEARANASRNIIDILKQIKITNTLTVGQYASHNDIILAGIEKTARDATIIKQYYTSALDVEIKMETNLLGGFLQLVLPDDIRQISKIKTENPANSSPKSGMGKIPYTGLIIDARELELEPILYPTIVSEQGNEIYSALFISREFAVQYGVCTYICSMDKAVQEERIGKHPLVFKGLRKSNNENASIVISMSDTKQIERVPERHIFLKECRVIIVLGQ
ncbi:MAG: hypothetical protein GY710_00175 [Desulfobacteraceae bacterium]|nr:hypothetical protein [Desulfobacteraceae bacterium]